MAHLLTHYSRLSHMFRKTQSYCDDCLVLLKVRHFVMECPVLVDMRERYLFRCHGEDGIFLDIANIWRKDSFPGHEALMFGLLNEFWLGFFFFKYILI